MKSFVYYVTPNAKAHDIYLMNLFAFDKSIFRTYKNMCCKMHVLGESFVKEYKDFKVIVVCVLNTDGLLNWSALSAVEKVLQKHTPYILNPDDLTKLF